MWNLRKNEASWKKEGASTIDPRGVGKLNDYSMNGWSDIRSFHTTSATTISPSRNNSFWRVTEEKG
jgi:hypothetical protein